MPDLKGTDMAVNLVDNISDLNPGDAVIYWSRMDGKWCPALVTTVTEGDITLRRKAGGDFATLSRKDERYPPVILWSATPEEPDDPWAHRAKGMRCATCMWWVEKARADGNAGDVSGRVLGRCRRHSPTAEKGFPPTFDNDWCGDHRLDENKVDTPSS